MVQAEVVSLPHGSEVGADFSRWGFFATGTVGQGDRDRGESDPGFDFDTYGLTAGVDYRVSDRVVLGAALGYNRNDTEPRPNGALDALIAGTTERRWPT